MKKIIITITLSFLGLSNMVKAQVITTIAPSAGLPNGIALDKAGNVYLTDGNAIAKIIVPANTFTVIAGDPGDNGDTGDGGPATAATLDEPHGVAVDAAGNVYIADYYNVAVRKITAATGIISTIAGNGQINLNGDNGPATNAGLGYVAGVAVDAAGNVYIVDGPGPNTITNIRKVTAATGIITTIAGTGTMGYSGDNGPAISAQLNLPSQVCLDAAGNIYVADQLSNRIRKITVATGIITTVVGTGTNGYTGDNGPATSAEINYPYAICFDAAGNMYFSDRGNEVIRKVTAATGIITTIAGNGTLGYAGDGGPAINAEFDDPRGVAIDSAGNIYIADNQNNVMRKIGPPGKSPGPISGNNSSICAGSIITYSISAVNGATSYTWTLPSGWSGSSTSTSIIATAGITNGYISVVANYTVGPSNPQTVAVTVNPLPSVSFSPINSACGNSSAFALTEGSPTGGIYSGIGVTANMFNPVTAGIGTQTVTYTYTNGYGCTGSATQKITVATAIIYDTVKITVTDTLIINAVLTGIAAPNNINTIKVYPNPANTQVTINYGNYTAMSGYTLKIINSLGQTVFTSSVNAPQTTIDLSTWSGKGAYIVQVINPNGNAIENRIIILQ